MTACSSANPELLICACYGRSCSVITSMQTGGHVRQSECGGFLQERPTRRSPRLSTNPSPTLLNEVQAGRNTSRELQGEDGIPPAVVLGCRLRRWSRIELGAAIGRTPRQAAELRRARIKRLKRGASK